MKLAVHHITTPKNWSDLKLDSATGEQITELKQQLKSFQGDAIAGPHRRQQGMIVLFNGSSRTDGQSVAALLGQETGADVYSINVAGIVSKYIGETEKNIDRVFAEAKDRKWILFFDEADALFGKRTEPKDSHDRYANAELNYLLQRIEEYGGLAIIATNIRSNIDEAFTRRFRYIINFPFPGSQ
jgi:SpoVK/Ycf46/Vps4 family AAA+-type ATPase